MEQISLMKPKGLDKNDTGMLEYLEDIVGTDRYVESIEEKAKKCATAVYCGHQTQWFTPTDLVYK